MISINNKFILFALAISSLIAKADTEIAIPLLQISREAEIPQVIHVGSASHIGKRVYMEDRHQIYSTPQGHFFAVYDGHSGKDVAEYAQKYLHQRLFAHPDFETQTPKAIAESFETIHRELDSLGEAAKAQGSTAVVALIKGKKLYLAWTGDSRAVVANGWGYVATWDHKPNGAELARVKKLGAYFDGHYIYGSHESGLSMTRALGDKHLSQIGLIPKPEIIVKDLEPQDDLLILGSDGIWDSFSNSKAICLAQKMIKDHSADNCEKVAAELVRKSSSPDNKTALVVCLETVGRKKQPPPTAWSRLVTLFCCSKSRRPPIADLLDQA